MRGEHVYCNAHELLTFGSAPRARGTRVLQCPRVVDLRISPACAGNTMAVCRNSETAPDQPRVRGEHQQALDTIDDLTGSAPRARGTQLLAERRHG